jgi:hypothetical protein
MKDKDRVTIRGRLAGVLASLYFSVPTVGLLWLLINSLFVRGSATVEVPFFLNGNYYFGVIIFLSILAFFSPNMYANIIGAIFKIFHSI